MKTKETIYYYVAGTIESTTKKITIPAGLRCRLTHNIPAPMPIKFWLDELTPEMEANEEFESWYRNYGVGLTVQDVDYEKGEVAKMFLEAIVELPREGGDPISGEINATTAKLLAQKALEYLK